MLTFLINNPERFACDLLAWPTLVAIIKVITGFGAQAAAVVYSLYLEDELTLIKFYGGATVIASLDDKLNAMVASMHSGELGAGKTIDDVPLEIGVH